MRRGEARDLEAVRAIQAGSPEASQWDAADYLGYEFVVAEAGARVAGFVVTRTLAPGEREVLNLAVLPEARRRGVGRALLQGAIGERGEMVYLEVRASNEVARIFYKVDGI